MLLKLIFSSFILRISNVVLIAGCTLFLAKIMNQNEFGTFTLVLSYVGVCIIPLQAGLPIINIRTISKKKNKLISKDLICFSIKTIIKYFTFLLVLKLLLALLGFDPISSYQYQFFFLAASMALLSIFSSYMQGLNLIIKSQLFEQILRPLIFLCFISIIYFSYFEDISNIQYKTYLFLYILSFVISAFFALIYLVATKQIDMTPTSTTEKKNWGKTLLPLSFLAGLQVLLNQLDIIFLGNIVNNAAVASYKIATQFAIVITLISTIIGTILAPQINRLYFNDPETLKHTIYKSNWVNFISGIFIIILFTFFAKDIITYLLGDSYKDSSQYLLILCFGYFISSLFGPISTITNMLSLEKFNLISAIISVCCNVLMLLILVPEFGNYGAALSTAVSLVVWKALLTYLTREKIHISCHIRFRS